jgi:hypothetical protein
MHRSLTFTLFLRHQLHKFLSPSRPWTFFFPLLLHLSVFFVDRTDFRDFHEVSCARQKSCVVLRFWLDSVPFGTPTLSEFPDLGSHELFLAFRRPKKKKRPHAD